MQRMRKSQIGNNMSPQMYSMASYRRGISIQDIQDIEFSSISAGVATSLLFNFFPVSFSLILFPKCWSSFGISSFSIKLELIGSDPLWPKDIIHWLKSHCFDWIANHLWAGQENECPLREEWWPGGHRIEGQYFLCWPPLRWWQSWFLANWNWWPILDSLPPTGEQEKSLPERKELNRRWILKYKSSSSWEERMGYCWVPISGWWPTWSGECLCCKDLRLRVGN